MENNIFREMKKEKIKLINEHAEYEKYNYLLKQTIQQLIQSNEKLLLGLKLRFEKLIRLSNQDYVMNTSISEKTQQVNKKEIEMSEISELEKEYIAKSINRSEKELNQIKTDLKFAQSSDTNIFSEISDLQKKKEKLLKGQQKLINSIDTLKRQNESNPSFSRFSKQFDQFNENIESIMMLRNQIFKIHKEIVDKERESFHKKSNGQFYLEPSKLLEVLSISQTPIDYLSSADNDDISGIPIIDIEPITITTTKPSNSKKNNENQNSNQIKNNFKNKKDDLNKKTDNSNYSKNQHSIDLIPPENDSKNTFMDKYSPKVKRKVIKNHPISDKEKSKNDNKYDDYNYDSELQSISFPDLPSDHLEKDNQTTKNKTKFENKPILNSIKKEAFRNSTSHKETSVSSSSKSVSITTTTNSGLSNQNSLPKLNFDTNSRSGNEKHILISPISTERKHDNSSNVLLNPINITSKERTSTNKNSLINIFNNGKNVKSSQNSPRIAGICKPSFTQNNSMLSQTAPLTPHGSNKPKITFSINDKENQNIKNEKSSDEKDQNINNEKNQIQKSSNEKDQNINNEKNQIHKSSSDEKDKNINNEKNQIQKSNDEKDQIQNTEKIITDEKSNENSRSNIINDSLVSQIKTNTNYQNNDDNEEDNKYALYADRKSQTKDSFITQSKIRTYSLQSIDKQLSVSNLELKVTDLQQEILDLEEECVQLNQNLMEARPGSRSFRKKKQPILLRELNLNSISIIEKNNGPFNIKHTSTQSEEEAPDIELMKNQIIQNSSIQSHFMMNQHKQELIKLLSTYKIELKMEKMNNFRKNAELNEELKRLKIVDPLMYYKELNIEPEEQVGDELAMKRETVYTKEKLENRIEEMKHDNVNLSFRINDLTFVTNQLQKKLTLMSKEPKYNVRHLCDDLKNDRTIINEILRQTAFVGIETQHVENSISKFNENYGQVVINQLNETTHKMKKQLDSMKIRFNNLRAVKEKRSIVLTSESEMKSLRFQQQDILNTIDVAKMRISGTISKIGKQLRSISDFNIRVPTPPPSLNIQEDE